MRIEKKYRVPKIVSADNKGLSWLRIALLLLMLLGVGWYAYQLGGSDKQMGVVGFIPSAKDKLKAMEEERDELRRQVSMLQQSSQVDQEAMLAIKEQIKQFQDERLKMEEELAFLRGIVSTSSNKKGLRIQNFKLEPGLEHDLFTYKFSVSQVINSGLVAKGSINLKVEGLLDGSSKILQLGAVSTEKLENHKMRFRFFQNIEGKLKLPEGFIPATLTIEVKPVNGKLAPVTETFNWSPVT